MVMINSARLAAATIQSRLEAGRPASQREINVIAAGQSLAVGHFISQETGTNGGQLKMIDVLNDYFPDTTFLNGANGGSYAARSSADIDVWKSSSPTGPFTTQAGSPIITVAYTAHATRVGALVNIASASAVGGITPAGNYRVTEIVNSNSFRIQHSSPASSGATGGGTPTITLYNPEFWWDNVNEQPGPMLLDMYGVIDASGKKPHVVLWAQGEADSFSMPSPTTAAEHKRCCKAIFDALRARYGSQLKVAIQGSPARRTAFNRFGNYQAIRENYWQLAEENSWIFLAADTYQGALVDSVHPDDAQYLATAERNALAILREYGRISVGGIGPVPVSVSRSGADIDITFAHDAGTDFNLSDFTPGSGLASFFAVMEAGVLLDISSVTKVNANTIRITTATTPLFAVDVYGGYDAMLTPDYSGVLDLAKVPFDNASVAMPIRPFKQSVAGAAFDPLLFSGLHVWFDASDVSTITQAGGLVSQWSDKSGNGRHATAAGSARPTYQAASVNGLGSIYSDGASGRGMTFPHALNVNDPFTILCVIQADTALTDPTTGSSVNFALGFGTGASSANWHSALRISTTNPGVVTWFAHGVGNTLGPGTNFSVPMQYTIGADATNSKAYYNGLLDSDIAKGAGPITMNGTGSLFNDAPIVSTRAYLGRICEKLVFNRWLSRVERQQFERYLMNKWAVS